MKRPERGNVLMIAILFVTVAMILLPALIKSIMSETKWTLREQKSTTAFHLAEAGVDRAMWKLRSATSTWSAAAEGTVIPGYNFDQTYTDDATGGTYRVRFSSGPSRLEVTIVSEGRDKKRDQTRAVRAVVKNQAIGAAIMSAGVIQHAGNFEVHWGPIMAQNNILISGNAADEYFPRKFSRQSVQGTKTYPRDTNGITPPNTDNTEWWSDYQVPELPQLDFTTMKSSAIINGTYNVYRHVEGTVAGVNHYSCESDSPSSACGTGPTYCSHFFDTYHHPLSQRNLNWYWDNNVIFSGYLGSGTGCHRNGLWGNIIVRGNMTIDSGDCLAFTGGNAVAPPAEAWREYSKISGATVDTKTTNQYPADNGYQKVASSFQLGNQSWTGGPSTANTDVGFRGFIYVGGNLTINSIADIYGAIWVVGNVVNNGPADERTLLFFDNNLELPTLNVILVTQSWRETTPSNAVWP